VKGRREGKLRKTSNVAKELAAKMTAACLIVVFFSAPRSSRVGGGATPFSQTPALFPSTASGATGNFALPGMFLSLF
jgi:hypothetical protein